MILDYGIVNALLQEQYPRPPKFESLLAGHLRHLINMGKVVKVIILFLIFGKIVFDFLVSLLRPHILFGLFAISLSAH